MHGTNGNKSKSFNCSGQICLMEGGNTQMHPYPTTCSNLKTYEIHRTNLIRPPFLKYFESLSFSQQEVSPLTDWQQHRENPSPGVHTIQAVAPNKAIPAPATASSKSNGYKVASWFGMSESISTSQCLEFFTCLQAKSYPQVHKLSMFSPKKTHLVFLGTNHNGLKAFIPALSRWYGTAKHQYCGITTWEDRALAVATRSTDGSMSFR